MMKKTKLLLLLFAVWFSTLANAQSGQVGINTTTPDVSAVFDVVSDTRGFLPPRLTEAQRDAINSPAQGLIIYNTTVPCLQVNDGTPTAPIWHCLNCCVTSGTPVVTLLDCANATNSGALTSGTGASGVSSIIPYTGGNGVAYPAQTVISTGVAGLTATRAAGTLATGAGSVTYTITGTPSTTGTASFAISLGGQSCTLTRTVATAAGTIVSLDCAGATNNGTLMDATLASSVSSSIPYTGGNGGAHSGQTVTSTGVTGLTATLTAGSFATGAGSLLYDITGTPSGSGTASFAINIGGQTCILTRTVATAAGTIVSLDCAGATNNGTLMDATLASSVSSSIPYTGGNGGAHSGQTVTSTGVTGLTATLIAGNFATGAGSLLYDITGTPSGSGTASFAINIGGQTCTLTRTVAAGTFNCLPTTTVVDITSSSGKVWMDRNLGASRPATKWKDEAAYGCLFQWGRKADGHQIRNSSTDIGPKAAGTEGDKFLRNFSTQDWLTVKDDTRWQTAAEPNNPCPSGYRIPTKAEFEAEVAANNFGSTTSSANSIFQWSAAGTRRVSDGAIIDTNASVIWTSTIDPAGGNPIGIAVYALRLPASSATPIGSNTRTSGYTVRCIKN